jgi:lipoate-protein ligase A
MNLRDALPGLSLDDLLDALEKEFLDRYRAPEVLRETKEPEGEEYASLAERYRSREWRLGRSPDCAVTVRRRFPWGGMEIRLNVKNGHAADPVVFSDAMDGEMILSLGKILEGVPFRWTEMAEAVRKAFPDSPEMAETALWLEEAPISGKKEADE